MSTIQKRYAVALRPVAARFLALTERLDRLQAKLDSRIVEQAKGGIADAVTHRR
jgi:hypothetical protein